MIIYHGSTDLVDRPEIRPSEVYLDFGTGFYTTTSYDQALRWAKTKMRRKNVDIGYVSVYDLDIDAAEKALNIRRFPQADVEWLMFVVNNRRGQPNATLADMTIGPVADDSVYTSIRLFETGVLDVEDTVKHLKTQKLHDQWAFHTAKMLAFCHFVRADEVRKENA